MNRGASRASPTLVFATSVAAMLALFRLLELVIAPFSTLPSSAYEGVAFLDDLPARWATLIAAHLSSLGIVVALLALPLALVVDARLFAGSGRRRLARLGAGWDAVDDGRALRVFTLAIIGITTWTLAAYSRNPYFDRLHLADRLVLLLLWLAVGWRPIAAIPYAVAAGAIAGQFTIPLGFISWTEMAVLLHFPVLLAAFWVVRSFTDSRRDDLFVFGWCCVVAVTFWTSGLGKLQIGWLTHPHITLLMLGAHANGWLANADADAIVRAAAGIATVTPVMMAMTLVLECGALLMLWRRWTLVGFFVLATSFHLAVFAMTGICFWKWMLADMALLVFLVRGDRLQRLALFTPGRFALSVAVIVSSPWWVHAENLTWFDTPLTYSLHFEGVDSRGETHVLPASFFRPYGDAVVLGTFPSISPHVQLTRGMGVTTDRDLARTLVSFTTADEVRALEAQRGVARYDAGAAAAFDEFVSRVARRAGCDATREPLLLRVLSPPRHLWTMPTQAALPCDQPLVVVRVLERTTFFDGERLRVIRERPLRTIHVGATSGLLTR